MEGRIARAEARGEDVVITENEMIISLPPTLDLCSVVLVLAQYISLSIETQVCVAYRNKICETAEGQSYWLSSFG